MKKEVCPECNGDGWIIGVFAAHGCDGSDEMCSRICPVPEQEQEQCNYCSGNGYIEDIN